MENTIKFCRKSGYVNNIFGRRSHFNGINDKNFNVRNFQERAAINAPIQGSASEVMRLAMIRLDKKLKEQREILRDQRLREIELEKMRKFDELENQKNSIDYGLKNRSINTEKIKQKELTRALDNFDIDKTKKN